MVLSAFLLVTLAVPAVVAYLLRRTRAWWLVGVALAGFGVALLLTLDRSDHHGEGTGAWYELGNALQIAYGAFMIVYAAIVLLASRAGRKAQPRREPPAML